jgi:phage terminase small subunit
MSARELTPKQEAFALAYFETRNGGEAYRRAYDVAEKTTDNWIYVEAWQLLSNPKIAQRLEQLEAEAVQLSIYTRHKAMEELEEARTAAFKLGQASAMVGATSAKIKLLGLDKPSRVEVTSPDGSMTPKSAITLTNLSDEELAQLERLTDKTRNSDGVGEAE